MSMATVLVFVVLGIMACKIYSVSEANAYVDAVLDVTDYLKERGIIDDKIIEELEDYLCEDEG